MTLPTAIKDPVNIGYLVLLCFFFLLLLHRLLLLFLSRRQTSQHISAAGQCNASTPNVFPFFQNSESDVFVTLAVIHSAHVRKLTWHKIFRWLSCGLREVSADFCPRQIRSDPSLQGTAVSYHCTNNHDTYFLLCFYMTLQSICFPLQQRYKKTEERATV